MLGSVLAATLGALSCTVEHPANLRWKLPSDPHSLNLYYGPGGAAHQPRGPFTFRTEDLTGTNPKFTVEDANGVIWTVKLGPEARPETAATRLVWAAGYFANEDYFLDHLTVNDLPRLHRGARYVGPEGSLTAVRLKRQATGEHKTGSWMWSSNRFSGTREMNGLRTLMALINNWDLTDENNAIYIESDGETRYEVSDLGSTFGNGRLSWPLAKGRGDVRGYARSKMLRSVRDEYVDFRVPTRPELFFIFTPREYFGKLKLRWIGEGVPRSHARWMGEQLDRISPQQFREAFRASGYSAAQADAVVSAIESRIAELKSL
jgi:hypothetical protein